MGEEEKIMEGEYKILVDSGLFEIIIQRLTLQLIEDYRDFDNTVLIGIQPRGVPLLDRIVNSIENEIQFRPVNGRLDISFYRDDYRRGEDLLSTYPTDINFTIEGKKVILVDDVLYTGRSVNAALAALNHYGRAFKTTMLTLVNRRFDRQLPVKADYIGLEIDALDQSYVKVRWDQIDGQDEILLKKAKE